MNINLKGSRAFDGASTVILKPGDPVLTGVPRGTEPNFISKMIIWADSKGKADPSLFSHAGIIGQGGTFAESTIIQMTFPKMEEVELSKVYGKAALRVWRLSGVSLQQRDAMIGAARAMLEHPWKKWYGVEKIALFFIDSLISKTVSALVRHPVELRFLSKFNITRRLVCSQVVAMLYKQYAEIDFSMSQGMVERLTEAVSKRLVEWLHKKTELRIAVDGPGVTPDDIDDNCTARMNAGFAEIVYEQNLPKAS